MIKIYSKPGCFRCKTLKSLCEYWSVDFNAYNAEYFLTYHENWRDDGSVIVLAASAWNNGELPIVIDTDGKFITNEKVSELMANAKKKIEEKIRAHAKEKGWRIVEKRLQAVLDNSGFCPCKSGKVKCPCPGHEKVVKETSFCACGMFDNVPF